MQTEEQEAILDILERLASPEDLESIANDVPYGLLSEVNANPTWEEVTPMLVNLLSISRSILFNAGGNLMNEYISNDGPGTFISPLSRREGFFVTST